MAGFGIGALGRARPFVAIVAVLLAISIPGPLWAQTTWQGTSTGDWSTNGNWSNNAPNAGSTANLTGLGGAHQPFLSAPSAANVLNMNGNDVAAGNTLHLDGQSLSITTLNMSAGTIVDTGFIAATGAYNLSGGSISSTLTGTAGVTVTGGIVTLSGANHYAGATNLNSGTLAVGNNGALSTSQLNMADGTTLQSATAVSLGNLIHITGTGTFDTNGNPTTLTGAISGGALTKTGNGTLTLGAVDGVRRQNI
jgi:fibronectin-binding autotransporter adhesin